MALENDSDAFPTEDEVEPWPYRRRFAGDPPGAFAPCDGDDVFGDEDGGECGDGRECDGARRASIADPSETAVCVDAAERDERAGVGDALGPDDRAGSERPGDCAAGYSYVSLAAPPKKRASEKPVLAACAAIVCVAVAAGVAYFLFTGAGGFRTEKQPETAEVALGPFEDVVACEGAVGPIETIEVAAGVAGVVEEIYVAEGDAVHAGEVVLTVSNDDVSAASAYAQSVYDAAQSAYDAAQESVRAADERWERAAQEVREGKRPIEEMAAFDDELETAYQVEQDAKQALDSAQGALHAATVEAGKCEVRASKSGIVASVGTEPGAYAPSGEALLSIDVFSSFAVRATVPASVAARISVGQTADITFSDIPEAHRSGTVTSIEPCASPEPLDAAADAGGASGQAGESFEVTISLRSQDQRIHAGMQARARIRVGYFEEALLVPSDALVREGDATFAIVARDGSSERVSVTVLGCGEGMCAVEGALSQGDRVVVGAAS